MTPLPRPNAADWWPVPVPYPLQNLTADDQRGVLWWRSVNAHLRGLPKDAIDALAGS